MNIGQKVLEIFNLFWLSSLTISNKKAIELSLIHIDLLIKTLEELTPDFEINTKIKEYIEIREIIKTFVKTK